MHIEKICKIRTFMILRLHFVRGDGTVRRVEQTLCCAIILVNVQYERGTTIHTR